MKASLKDGTRQRCAPPGTIVQEPSRRNLTSEEKGSDFGRNRNHYPQYRILILSRSTDVAAAPTVKDATGSASYTSASQRSFSFCSLNPRHQPFDVCHPKLRIGSEGVTIPGARHIECEELAL